MVLCGVLYGLEGFEKAWLEETLLFVGSMEHNKEIGMHCIQKIMK